MRSHVVVFLSTVPLAGALLPRPTAQIATAPTTALVADRDPVDLALVSPTAAAIANRRTGTVALVDLDSGALRAELNVGAEPTCVVAAGPAGKLVATTYGGGEVLLLETSPELRVSRRLSLGGQPRGVAVSRGGNRAWVALSDSHAVVEVDLEAMRVVRRANLPGEPWHVALSPDGKRLAVGCPKAREVIVLDTTTMAPSHRTRTAGRNLRRMAIDNKGQWVYVPMIAERQAPADRVNIDRGWVVGNRLARVSLVSDEPREAITLDTTGAGVADVEGCDISSDGTAMAVAAAGSHEVVLFEDVGRLPFVSFGGPGDHVDPESRRRWARIRVDGAPVSCRFTQDGRALWVVERFGNRLVRIDRTTRRIDRTIALPSPPQASLERRGEAIFHDASRSFGSWYSCATCHTEGHTNGGSFDTLNDGGYGKPKLTPSLRGVAKTGPYTWHGWQTSLRDAVAESFTKSMQGPLPPESDIDAVSAWLRTLEPPRSPISTGPASERGARLFVTKGCVRCHGGSEHTSAGTYRVGLEEPNDHYAGFNPPSLRNVRQRGPWLHDGRATTLEEVVGTHHRPSLLGTGSDLTPAEIRDLVAYLRTL